MISNEIDSSSENNRSIQMSNHDQAKSFNRIENEEQNMIIKDGEIVKLNHPERMDDLEK